MSTSDWVLAVDSSDQISPASKRLIDQDRVPMNGYEIETVDRVSAVYRDMIAGIWWD